MKNNLFAQEKLDYAKIWIREAGSFLRANLYGHLEVREKSNFTDLVTNFDKQVQNLLLEHIQSEFPRDKILAEESGQSQNDFDREKENFWLIDPIDGTANFVVQQDNFAVMIAYYQKGQAQFGLILDVMNDKLYWNDKDKVYCNKQPLAPHNKELKQGLVAMSSWIYRDNAYHLANFANKSLGVRMIGSAGLTHAAMLEGKIIAYFSYLQPWDYAAGSILLAKLGVVSKTFSGAKPDLKTQQLVYSIGEHLETELRLSLKEE